jgi:hypothetical protein
MKKSILSITAAVLLVAAGSANAQTYTIDGRTITVDSQATLARFCQRYPNARVCQQVQQVPEIDAGSGTRALALVLGLGLLSAEALRRRRRSIPTAR